MPASEIERSETARLKRTVFDMRQNARPYRDIAQDLNLSVTTVRAYYIEMCAILVPTEEVTEIRNRDIDGYDKSEALCLHSIQLVTKQIDEDLKDEKPVEAKMIELLAKLNDQLTSIRTARAKLIGANMPIQVNHNLTVRTQYDEQIEALTSELLNGGNVMSKPDDVLIEE